MHPKVYFKSLLAKEMMKKQTRGLTFTLNLQIGISLKCSLLNVFSNVSKHWESEGSVFTIKQLHNALVMKDLKHKPVCQRNAPLKKATFWKHVEPSDEQRMTWWLGIWNMVQVHFGSHSHPVRRKPRDKHIKKGKISLCLNITLTYEH